MHALERAPALRASLRAAALQVSVGRWVGRYRRARSVRSVRDVARDTLYKYLPTLLNHGAAALPRPLCVRPTHLLTIHLLLQPYHGLALELALSAAGRQHGATGRQHGANLGAPSACYWASLLDGQVRYLVITPLGPVGLLLGIAP